MNQLKLDNTGGLYTYQEILAYMQDAYTQAINNLVALVGNNVIIEGCEITGATISDGLVVYNNEILPFVGGDYTGFVAVVEVVTTAPYVIGGSKPFYAERKLKCTGSGIPFSVLARIGTLKGHYQRTDNPHGVTKHQAGLGNLPNAKSDSALLDSSETLATSKAVYNIWRSIKSGTATAASVTEGTKITVTHNLGYASYRVFLTNSSSDIYDDKRLQQGVMSIGVNSFVIRVSVSSGSTVTDYKCDWVVIPYSI